MNPTHSRITWRFGERDDHAVEWLRAPTILHAYVDFQSPATPAGQWHRIMVVTRSWLEHQVAEPWRAAIWPPLLIVSDGTRAEIEASIEQQLSRGWRLIVGNATLLPPGYEPTEI